MCWGEESVHLSEGLVKHCDGPCVQGGAMTGALNQGSSLLDSVELSEAREGRGSTSHRVCYSVELSEAREGRGSTSHRVCYSLLYSDFFLRDESSHSQKCFFFFFYRLYLLSFTVQQTFVPFS